MSHRWGMRLIVAVSCAALLAGVGAQDSVPPPVPADGPTAEQLDKAREILGDAAASPDATGASAGAAAAAAAAEDERTKDVSPFEAYVQGQVTGDIRAPRVSFGEGAIFEGNVEMRTAARKDGATS